jgi:hypothetical protein
VRKIRKRKLSINLISMHCPQARECLFEKNELGLYEEDDEGGGERKKKKSDIDKFLAVGQEAAYVSFILGWAGLGWAGLGWAGLGWAGLGWAGLGWAGLG